MNNLPDTTTDKQALPYQEYPALKPDIQSPTYVNLCEIAAELISQGTSYRATAVKIGVHHDTIEYWVKYSPHFRSLIEYKKHEYRLDLLSSIDKARHKNWFAAAWILERNKVFGGEFKQQAAQSQGSAVNIQINVAHPGMVQVSQVQETDSDLEK